MKIITLLYMCFLCSFNVLPQRFQKDKISIFYKSNAHKLEKEQINKINNFIEYYNDAKINKIVIISSADYKGNNQYNLELSKKRASEVANLIEDKNNLKIQIRYLGEKKKPINHTSKDGVVSHRKTEVICEYILPKSQRKKPKFYKSVKKNYLTKLNHIEKNKSIRLRNINFFYGKTKTTQDAKQEMKNLLEVMNKNEKLEISLEGHVCCNKSKKKEYYNGIHKLNTLSTKRAKKIHDYLIINGIDSTRVSFKGYEFSKPIYYPERNERHRSLNRRVEVKVLEN